METHKAGTQVLNTANGAGQIQVSPNDPLVGELLVANIMGGSIGKRLEEGDVVVRTDQDGTKQK